MEFIAALSFLWLGMVIAISFLEAPLKFRAPDVTLQVGLGIGRLVFRALNACEIVLAALIAVELLADETERDVVIAALSAFAALVIQLVAVRPALSLRTDRVLAGDSAGSKVHLMYIALEVVKVAALVVLGVLALR